MMTKAPKQIPLVCPTISQASIDAAQETLRSGWLGYGPRCHDLEALFLKLRGGWALATQSCTAALWAIASIIKSDDYPEIIIPANTYIACASAFLVAGWKVRICDVHPDTGLLLLDDAKLCLTPRTRAMLIVDTYGQRYPEFEARQFCNDHGLFLIRDAAHRIDLNDGTPQSDFVCYSFGPTKELASPDGGLIWSSFAHFEGPARALTYWGISQDTWQRSSCRVHSSIGTTVVPGLKLRMTDVNASIVMAQLKSWPQQRSVRQALVNSYFTAFSGRQAVLPPRKSDDSCLMLPILVDPGKRAVIRERLGDLGISTSDHYPNLATVFGGDYTNCKNAELFCTSVIAMPMHLGLTEDVIALAASVF